MPPFLQGGQQKKKRRDQQYMIEAGEIEQCIKSIGYHESGQFCPLVNKPFPGHNLPHPVAREGQDIPQDNKPEEAFELKPALSNNPVAVNTEKQVCHSGDKKDMPYLVGYESLGTPMLLDGKSRSGPEQEKYEVNSRVYQFENILFTEGLWHILYPKSYIAGAMWRVWPISALLHSFKKFNCSINEGHLFMITTDQKF